MLLAQVCSRDEGLEALAVVEASAGDMGVPLPISPLVCRRASDPRLWAGSMPVLHCADTMNTSPAHCSGLQRISV